MKASRGRSAPIFEILVFARIVGDTACRMQNAIIGWVAQKRRIER